ncbi:MAG: DNA-directed RNA polymerase subunit K [Candidatus Altiarchaeota archaeon]|nr:DNA-directed RNA polymerase subunit K [Candidatus Altiarchaeota archaeon]
MKLTRFERARAIGARSLQLALGAPVLTKLPKDMVNAEPIEIAEYELNKKAIPIVVVRIYPDGKKEVLEAS